MVDSSCKCFQNFPSALDSHGLCSLGSQQGGRLYQLENLRKVDCCHRVKGLAAPQENIFLNIYTNWDSFSLRFIAPTLSFCNGLRPAPDKAPSREAKAAQLAVVVLVRPRPRMTKGYVLAGL